MLLFFACLSQKLHPVDVYKKLSDKGFLVSSFYVCICNIFKNRIWSPRYVCHFFKLILESNKSKVDWPNFAYKMVNRLAIYEAYSFSIDNNLDSQSAKEFSFVVIYEVDLNTPSAFAS